MLAYVYNVELFCLIRICDICDMLYHCLYEQMNVVVIDLSICV